MAKLGSPLSLILGPRCKSERIARPRLRSLLIFEHLEDRTVPAILSQIANVDGYVADANQDGIFDTVNSTGPAVQTSLIPATGAATDQSNTPTPYNMYNLSYAGSLPIGQEFRPSLSSLNYVDLFIEDAGSDIGPGANFTVRIRAGTITGTILAYTSGYVPDGTNTGGGSTYSRFMFSSPVSLTPGSTYVIQVIQTSTGTGTGNFMLVADSPSADTYTSGRAIISGTPSTTNVDFLFREGVSSQPGVTERGVLEFSTAGIPAGSIINSATLSGYASRAEATPGAPLDVSFYGYAGNGQITTADATASSTRYGESISPVVGAFSVGLDPAAIQSLLNSGNYTGYLGIVMGVLSGQRFFLDSKEVANLKPTLTIDFTPSPQPPVAGNDSFRLQPGMTDLTVAAPGVLANDSDINGDALTASLVSGPSQGTVTLAADGSFTYAPGADFTDSDSFTYQASDGAFTSNTATVTINLNHAPVAYARTYVVTSNTTLNVQAPGVLANNYDPDGDPLTAVLIDGPSHGTLTLNSNGSFSYTPQSSYLGKDQFTYQASDGSLNSGTTIVSLYVNAVPVAQNDSYSVNQDSVLAVSAPGVLGNDSDANGDSLTASLVGNPSHGTVSLSSNGSFQYTPAAGYYGSDSFTYRASDGYASSNTATVSIAVNHVNHAPAAAADGYATSDGVALNVAAPGVLANDSDPDGDAVTAVLVSGPSHGTLTLGSNGSVSYAPVPGYTGTDSFSYQASDGSLRSTPTTVTITIHSLPDLPWIERGGDGGHTAYVDVAINAAGITDAWNQSINYLASGDWAQNGNRGVAIDGARVYRTELDGYWGNGNYHIMAFDLQTGAPLWNQIIVGNGSVSAPSVANGLVYINRSGHSGISGGTAADLPRLYALSGQTGATVLQTTYAAQWESDERPAISGNQLISWDGYYGGFSSWNASTLVRQWNNGGSIYNPPLAAFDNQYVYAYDNKVYLRSTGAFVHNIVGPAAYPWIADPMVSSSGRVFFEVRNDQYYPNAYAISAYDGTTHLPIWTFPLPTAAGAKAVGNGVVAVTAGKQLFILRESDGALLQTWQAPQGLTPQIVLTRSHVFVESSDYYYGSPSVVYAVNLFTGQAEWSFQNTLRDENNYTLMEMAMSGGHLLLSHDGFVRAFTVTAAHPPDAVDDSAGTNEDTPVAIPVLSNDSDRDGDTLIVTATGPAAHGSVSIQADGTVLYSPTPNYNGSDSFTYTIDDRHGGSDTATVTISIAAVNDAPVAAVDSYSKDEDSVLTVAAPGVLANDTDVDGDSLTAALVSGPAHGTLTLNADGSFQYTPDANFNGADAFTYKASDGTLDSSPVTVTIVVNAVNDAPVAADDAYSTDEDTPLIVAAPGILDNDTDVEGDALSAILVAGPSHGTLRLNADGSFTYVPAANYNGADSFTYQVNDGQADSNVATVALTIRPVNDAPVAAAGPDQTANEAATVSFDGSGSFDVDGDALTFAWNFGDGGTAGGANVSHAYADNGVYTVTLTINDGHGGVATDTASVTVTNVAPAASVSGPASGVRGQARTFTFSANDPSPADQAAGFTYSITWGDGSTQTVSGPASKSVDHTFTASGTYTVTVSATDKDGGKSTTIQQAITIKAVDLQGGVLAVGGTTGDDAIVISPNDAQGNLKVTIGGVSQGTFAPGLSQILVFGQAGNDNIQLVNTKIHGTTYYVTAPAILFGDAGGDTLDARGSTANNILSGGDGNDTVQGGAGRDILLGGAGADTLRGNGGDDVLIGNTTDFDVNLAALNALMAEWARADADYATRTNHLRGLASGGNNGAYLLNSSTIHDDAALDQLYGGSELDLFFYTALGIKDKVNDASGSEQIVAI